MTVTSCRKTNLPIKIKDNCTVYNPGTDEIVGWGWFEFDESGLWFREDFHPEISAGMSPFVISNILNYEFEIFH